MLSHARFDLFLKFGFFKISGCSLYALHVEQVSLNLFINSC